MRLIRQHHVADAPERKQKPTYFVPPPREKKPGGGAERVAAQPVYFQPPVTVDYWHGDPLRDIIGRTEDELRYQIQFKEGSLKIRQSYSSSREGYHIRTAEIMRDLEIDRLWLAQLLDRKKRMGL